MERFKAVGRFVVILVAVLLGAVVMAEASSTTKINRVTKKATAGSLPSVGSAAKPAPPLPICGKGAPTLLSATERHISVDGCDDDWLYPTPVSVVASDPKGDFEPTGSDVFSLLVTNDSEYVYFLYRFVGQPKEPVFLIVDVDGNAATGCKILPGFGAEYGLTFLPMEPYKSYIGDARDCGWGDTDFPGALKVAVGQNFIEASVPIKVLATLAPKGLQTLTLVCMNDFCGPAKYAMQEEEERPGVGGAITGVKPFMAICWNMTTGQQVFTLGVSEWDCEKIGLKVEPGETVFIGGMGTVPREKEDRIR